MADGEVKPPLKLIRGEGLGFEEHYREWCVAGCPLLQTYAPSMRAVTEPVTLASVAALYDHIMPRPRPAAVAVSPARLLFYPIA